MIEIEDDGAILADLIAETIKMHQMYLDLEQLREVTNPYVVRKSLAQWEKEVVEQQALVDTLKEIVLSGPKQYEQVTVSSPVVHGWQVFPVKGVGTIMRHEDGWHMHPFELPGLD